VGVHYDLIVDGEIEGKYEQCNLLPVEYRGVDPSCDVNIEEENSYIDNRNDFMVDKEVISNLDKININAIDDEEMRQLEIVKSEEEDKIKEEKDPLRVLEEGYSKCEDEFTFILKTREDGFEKGSQLYLAYNTWPNEYLIEVYGFCSANNVYNSAKINVVLNELEMENIFKFKKRNTEYVDNVFGEMDYYNRQFRVSIDGLNLKLLKFVKISILPIEEYPLKTILKPAVLEVEKRAIEKTISHLKVALQSFPTTYEEDIEQLKTETRGFNYHVALVYRSELKKLILNQIKALEILLHIIERLIEHKDFTTAVERVESLESEEDVKMNRKILQSYLHQLKHELDNNQ